MSTPEKRLAAVCGLFCPSCTIYIATQEDPARLALLAQRSGRTVEEVKCDGCRAERRTPFCSTCKMSACAAEKGISFCVECADYPCEEIKAFQAARPHRIELWQAQERIQEVGWEAWYAEMSEHYACPQCGTLNSAYDFKCRKCGATPSCGYMREHGAEVGAFLQRQAKQARNS